MKFEWRELWPFQIASKQMSPWIRRPQIQRSPPRLYRRSSLWQREVEDVWSCRSWSHRRGVFERNLKKTLWPFWNLSEIWGFLCDIGSEDAEEALELLSKWFWSVGERFVCRGWLVCRYLTELVMDIYFNFFWLQLIFSILQIYEITFKLVKWLLIKWRRINYINTP